MLLESSKLVTLSNGPRPAGKPDECFYCKQKIGQEHKTDCVCRVKLVMVKIEAVIPRIVPSDWDSDDVEFQLNESSWCANNIRSDIDTFFDAKSETSPCLCSQFSGSYVREAAAEDIEGLDLAVLRKGR